MKENDPYAAPQSPLQKKDEGRIPRKIIITLCALTVLQIAWKAWYLPTYLQMVQYGAISFGPFMLGNLLNLLLLLGIVRLAQGKNPRILLPLSGGGLLLFCLFSKTLPLTFAAQGFHWQAAAIGLFASYAVHKWG